jgi:predicted nucleic acid-binding Zn ribbon protein
MSISSHIQKTLEFCQDNCQMISREKNPDQAAKISYWSGDTFCTQYASKYGWCGNTDAHKYGGTDCSKCGDTFDLPKIKKEMDSEFCEDNCKMISREKDPDQAAKISSWSGDTFCTQYASRYGWCGNTDAHKYGGTDCSRCNQFT